MILIIDNYDSFTYNLYQLVASLYADVQVFRNDQITLSDINQPAIRGIILSPGPGRPENAGICISLIQALMLKTVRLIPLLGVCLGHQAIVTALNGRVIQANEILHGKQDFIYHYKKNLYRHLSLPFKAGRYHSLIAERETLPSCLIIEAETKQKIIMGVRHATFPLFGVQFHPESILTPEGKKLLTSFITICLQNTT